MRYMEIQGDAGRYRGLSFTSIDLTERLPVIISAEGLSGWVKIIGHLHRLDGGDRLLVASDRVEREDALLKRRVVLDDRALERRCPGGPDLAGEQ